MGRVGSELADGIAGGSRQERGVDEHSGRLDGLNWVCSPRRSAGSTEKGKEAYEDNGHCHGSTDCKSHRSSSCGGGTYSANDLGVCI